MNKTKGDRQKQQQGEVEVGREQQQEGMEVDSEQQQLGGEQEEEQKGQQQLGQEEEMEGKAVTVHPSRLRRARRKTATEIESDIQLKIKTKCQENLEVKITPGKGRGVITTHAFKKNDFVLEYVGEVLKGGKARDRVQGQKSLSTGSYIFEFDHNGKKWCIDATDEEKYLQYFGRLINHSRKKPNLVPRKFVVESEPHLVFLACKDIDVGQELQYDYNDRSKKSLAMFPWLKN